MTVHALTIVFEGRNSVIYSFLLVVRVLSLLTRSAVTNE